MGAAVPGSGFFVLPDIRNSIPEKEIFQGVIRVISGNVTARQLEAEFT